MNLKRAVGNKILILFIAIVVIIGTLAVGVELYSAPIANIHGEVKKAEIQSKTMNISLGDLNSGEKFRKIENSYNTLVINNVSEVKIDIIIQNFDDEERAAFKNINVTIIIGDHHQNGTWDEYLNGTINLLEMQNLSGTLQGNHKYDVKIVVEGTVGYPSENVNVEFSLVITVESP